MSRILMLICAVVLGYVGYETYQTGSIPSPSALLGGGGGGGFAGGYGMAVDGARSMGPSIGGLAGGCGK